MESPFPSRAELDPPEQTPHVCLLACSPHPDGSTDAAARLLEHGILAKWPEAPVRIVPCSGLCSFYAQDQGIIITY
mgnify:CR=1 FL=1